MISLSKIKLTSSKLGSTELSGVVSGIIIKASEKLMLRFVMRETQRLKVIAKEWQMFIRLKLGRQIPKYHMGVNRTPWPARRTGKLQSSIKKPKLTVDEYGGTFGSGLGLPRYRFKLSGLFGRRGSSSHYGNTRLADVGKHLNDLSNKPYGGWRDRAQKLLFESMKERLLKQ